MAVVDSVSHVRDHFVNRSLDMEKKIESATVKIKVTLALGAMGFFFFTGIISASAFSLILGFGQAAGTLFSDNSLGQALGYITIGCVVICVALLTVVLWKRALLKSHSKVKAP